MNHPSELLAGYILSDLDEQERALVKAHLRTCRSCRTELAQLRETLFSLPDTLPSAPFTPDLWSRIESQLEPQLPVQVHQTRRSWRPSVRLILAAVAVAASIVVGVIASTAVPQWKQATTRTAALQPWVSQGAVQRRLIAADGVQFGVVMVRSDGQALIVLDTPAPEGRVYQVWGRLPDGPRLGVPISLGVMNGLNMQVAWTGFKTIGISVELPGGRPFPTNRLGRINIPG